MFEMIHKDLSLPPGGFYSISRFSSRALQLRSISSHQKSKLGMSAQALDFTSFPWQEQSSPGNVTAATIDININSKGVAPCPAAAVSIDNNLEIFKS